VRILILNWRCPRHPKAGGAEIFTQQIARRLVATGNTVEWFSAGFAGAPPEEDIDGMHFVRAGRQGTVHCRAFQHYRGKLKGRFDAVIDEVNTIPFFTPLWAEIPAFMLIFQLAREVWWYESPFPVNALGYASEPLYLRLYRRSPVFTISKSTEIDLRRLGFDGPITIIPVGLEPVSVKAGEKSAVPTFLYVGRLSPSKRVADIIRAFARFNTLVAPAELWLVGDGSPKFVDSLRQLGRQLKVEARVKFLGRVSDPEKHALMARAHALLMTSAREGWGLVVTEANACGTPAIVYDVPGLRDAVINEETGLVVSPDPNRLADAMRRLWLDPHLYSSVANRAREWSHDFSFDKAAEIVQDEIARRVA